MRSGQSQAHLGQVPIFQEAVTGLITELFSVPIVVSIQDPKQANNPNPVVQALRENLTALVQVGRMIQASTSLPDLLVDYRVPAFLQCAQALPELIGNFDEKALSFDQPSEQAQQSLDSPDTISRTTSIGELNPNSSADSVTQFLLNASAASGSSKLPTSAIGFGSSLNESAVSLFNELKDTNNDLDDAYFFNFLELSYRNFDQILKEAEPAKILILLALFKNQNLGIDKIYKHEKEYFYVYKRFHDSYHKFINKLKTEPGFKEQCFKLVQANLDMFTDFDSDTRRDEAPFAAELRYLFQVEINDREEESLYGILFNKDRLKSLTEFEADAIAQVVLESSRNTMMPVQFFRLALNLLSSKTQYKVEIEDYLLQQSFRFNSIPDDIEYALERPMLIQAIEYLYKARKEDFKNKLVNSIINLPEYSKKENTIRAWLDRRVKSRSLNDELKENNIAPDFFSMEGSRVVFSEEFKKIIEAELKSKLESDLAKDPNLAMYTSAGGCDWNTLIDSLELAQSMSVKTSGLLGGDDTKLIKRLSAALPEGTLIANPDSDEMLALTHHYHKMDLLVDPDPRIKFNEDLYKAYILLSISKVLPAEYLSKITPEDISKAIELNLKNAENKVLKEYEFLKIFRFYLNANDKKEIINYALAEDAKQPFQALQNVIDKFKTYGLSFADLFQDDNSVHDRLGLTAEHRERVKTLIKANLSGYWLNTLISSKREACTHVILKKKEFTDYCARLLADPNQYKDAFDLEAKLNGFIASPQSKQVLRGIFEAYFSATQLKTEEEFFRVFNNLRDEQALLFAEEINQNIYNWRNNCPDPVLNNEFLDRVRLNLETVETNLHQDSFLRHSFNQLKKNMSFVSAVKLFDPDLLNQLFSFHFSENQDFIQRARTSEQSYRRQVPFSQLRLLTASGQPVLINDNHSTRAPSGTDYRGTREFVNGDNSARINANASLRTGALRTGRLLVNEFSDPGDIQAHEFHIDLSTLASGDAEHNITKLMSFLYHNVFKTCLSRPFVLFTLKGDCILKLGKLELNKIFGSGNMITDQYSSRTYFQDFYLSLVALINNHLVKGGGRDEIFAKDLLKNLIPSNYKTQAPVKTSIVIYNDDNRSIALTQPIFKRLQEKNGAEVLRLSLF